MSVRDASKYLSLSEAIDTLKAELLKADSKARRDKSAFFTFKEAEIELALEFEPKIEAGFNIGVFKISTGAGVKGGHKIVVRFESAVPLQAAARAVGASVPQRLGQAKTNPAKLVPPRAASSKKK